MRRPAGAARFPRLIVCEGEADRLFLHHFIEIRNLPRCHIISAGGKNRIGDRIKAYSLEPKSNWPSIGRVLVVGDNDDDPEARFTSIQQQIDAFLPGHAPADRRVKSANSPYFTILMVPWDNDHGSLEA